MAEIEDRAFAEMWLDTSRTRVDIQRAIGMSPSAQRRRAEQLGLPTAPREPRLPERPAAVATLATQGLSAPEISKLLSIPGGTIRHMARRLGLRVANITPRLTAADKATIVSLYQKGVRTEEIAAHIGVNRSTVNRCARQADEPPRPMGRRRTWDSAQVQQLYAEGKSDREISSELGVSRTAVFRARKALGLPTKFPTPWLHPTSLAAALALLFSTVAPAQEHPMHPPPGAPDPYAGIQNDAHQDCCGGKDCRPLVEPTRFGPAGTEVQLNGAWTPVPPALFGPSPDGGPHICTYYQSGRPAVRCLLIPGSA